MWIFNKWRYFARKGTVRESCHNQKVEHLPLGSNLEKPTSIAEKQYHRWHGNAKKLTIPDNGEPTWKNIDQI